MSYVVMAIQEEGSEIRISDWDDHDRGFDDYNRAMTALGKAIEEYVEYRQIWVEELKDAAYWYERMSREEYDDYDRFGDYGE